MADKIPEGKYNIICTKCNLQGISKCPFCRSVFTDCHHYYGLIRLDSHASRLNSDEGHLILNYPMHGCTYDQAMLGLKELIDYHYNGELGKFHQSPTWDQIACIHSWKFKEGCKSEIGCNH